MPTVGSRVGLARVGLWALSTSVVAVSLPGAASASRIDAKERAAKKACMTGDPVKGPSVRARIAQPHRFASSAGTDPSHAGALGGAVEPAQVEREIARIEIDDVGVAAQAVSHAKEVASLGSGTERDSQEVDFVSR